MRGRGRGRGRGSATQRQINASIRRNERQDRGQTFTPSLMPPSFARVPWNSFTFSATYAGGATINITSATIRDYCRSLCGISNTATVAIKVEKARIWNIATGGTDGFSMPNIAASFYELTLNNSNVQNVRQLESDHGTLNMPARVAYIWPIGDRSEILSNAESLTVLTTYGATGSSVVIMINFLWRSVSTTEDDLPSSLVKSAELLPPP